MIESTLSCCRALYKVASNSWICCKKSQNIYVGFTAALNTEYVLLDIEIHTHTYHVGLVQGLFSVVQLLL